MLGAPKCVLAFGERFFYSNHNNHGPGMKWKKVDD
jgi:hypothetical protein